MRIPKFLKELPLGDVTLIEKGLLKDGLRHYEIEFNTTTNKDVTYTLAFAIDQSKNNYYVSHFSHFIRPEKECYYCGLIGERRNSDCMCSLFDLLHEELLEVLFEHPNVRLKLLF